MNCDDVQNLLVEYLLDELSDDKRFVIAMHMKRGCARCLDFEREILDGMDGLFTAIPEDPISPEHRSQILARATSVTPYSPIRTASSSTFNHSAEFHVWTSALPYLLAFAAGVLLMATVFPFRSANSSAGNVPDPKLSSLSNSFAVDPATIPSDSEISVGNHKNTLMVSMERSNKSSEIEGRIVWDNLSHEVHFFGNGVAPSPPGMRYVMWLTDQYDQPLASKELTLDEKGRCKATIVTSMLDVRYVFITLESKLAGITQPSSNVQLSLDASRLNLTRL